MELMLMSQVQDLIIRERMRNLESSLGLSRDIRRI